MEDNYLRKPTGDEHGGRVPILPSRGTRRTPTSQVKIFVIITSELLRDCLHWILVIESVECGLPLSLIHI